MRNYAVNFMKITQSSCRKCLNGRHKDPPLVPDLSLLDPQRPRDRSPGDDPSYADNCPSRERQAYRRPLVCITSPTVRHESFYIYAKTLSTFDLILPSFFGTLLRGVISRRPGSTGRMMFYRWSRWN